MLMPMRARLLRVAHLHRLAVDQHAAGIGLDRAVDDLHQRGLAGAVLAQHGMGLARLHGQRDIAVGHDGRIALGDAAQLQSGGGHSAFSMKLFVFYGSRPAVDTG
jgi:hypothetical protein